MNIKFLFAAFSLLLLLGACSAEETQQPEEIEIELSDFGITETFTEDDIVSELSAAIDEVEWQSSAPEMGERPIAVLTFFYPSAEDASKQKVEYEVWFNEDSALLEILGSEEDQVYGILDEENSQELSDLIFENTIEEFSLEQSGAWVT